jgi:hypothetical protein
LVIHTNSQFWDKLKEQASYWFLGQKPVFCSQKRSRTFHGLAGGISKTTATGAIEAASKS